MLLRRVRIAPAKPLCDVLVRDGRVVAVGTDLTAGDTDVVDGRGHALLPGLHDHHIHLLATAAAANSVVCGPPTVHTLGDLTAVLRAAPAPGGWLRGVGFDEQAVGPLDRDVLDAIRADVAVRVQHRGGSLWVLNSRAVRSLGLDGAAHPGVERDAGGVPTGRIWRADALLRDLLPDRALPELGALSRRLAGFGVTGVTDATPDLDPIAVAALTGPEVVQRVVLLGAPGDAPSKIVVSDHELPSPAELVAVIGERRPRAVAVHCVTREALLLTLAALNDVGVVAGDRIEHAAVVPPEAAGELAASGITVVTQPSLVARRGDDYLDRVDADDLPVLWPFASLDAAGVRVGCSSDAPYGDPDPWATIRAAVERRAPSGRPVAAHEAVTAHRALCGFLTDPSDPGGAVRRIEPGAPADLVLLDRSLDAALTEPCADAVRMTVIAGRRVG